MKSYRGSPLCFRANKLTREGDRGGSVGQGRGGDGGGRGSGDGEGSDARGRGGEGGGRGGGEENIEVQ